MRYTLLQITQEFYKEVAYFATTCLKSDTPYANNLWFRKIIGEDNGGVVSTDDEIHQQQYDDFLAATSMRDYPDNWDELREAVLTRDNHRCEVCGRDREDGCTLQVHHIVPLGMGGTNARSNLITLCNEHHGRVHGGKS